MKNFSVEVIEQSITSSAPLTVGGGDAFVIVSNSADDLVVKFYRGNQQVGICTNVGQGLMIGRKDFGGLDSNENAFSKAVISCTTSQTVKVAFGVGDVVYNVLGGTITTSVGKNTVIDSVADVSATGAATTLMLAANADRRGVMISNPAGNLATHRIGDSGAGVTNGIPLAPGETITIETSAAVYSYNPGATESLSIMGIED